MHGEYNKADVVAAHQLDMTKQKNIECGRGSFAD
jgi:hypothetical protein